MGNEKVQRDPRPVRGVFEAYTGPGGSVHRGAKINLKRAEALRRSGRDVVVCGADDSSNRERAASIERNANGAIKHCGPHPNAGPNALWHYQPHSRPPEGHTFYETTTRKAL
jgi:hypothetical protein